MKNEIQKINENITSLLDSNNIINKIITRGAEEKFELKTLTSEDLVEISNFMPEVNRTINSFAKHQSQFMNNTMTLSSFSPIRNLRQILAEIENRRGALKENIFKIKKNVVMLEQKRELYSNEKDKYQKALYKIEIEEMESNIVDTRVYIEASLKTILSYQQAYNDIKEKYNISDTWDEKDFEMAEEEHHITKAFQQAHADILCTGRITQGNHEYFWQCGINPQSAYNDLIEYIQSEDKDLKNPGVLSEKKLEINSFIDFLKRMAKKYKGSSRKILEFKGINPDGFYENALFKDLDI